MVQDRDPAVRAVADALAEPFDPREVKFKPQQVKQNRCLAMAYIDARLVQDRLDEVLGVESWADEYTILPDGSVMCALKCRLGDGWVTKSDVGSTSEQPDPGDRLKAAFSDALKRAAVKFGIGRYLYRLPASWVDYDPTKKQIVQPPQLPAWALPKNMAPAAKNPAKKAEPPAPAADPAHFADLPHGTGSELLQALRDRDAGLAQAGLCRAGALVSYITAASGRSVDISTWKGPVLKWAADEAAFFAGVCVDLSRVASAADLGELWQGLEGNTALQTALGHQRDRRLAELKK